MKIQEIYDLVRLLKTKGMQVEIFKLMRSYSSVYYDINDAKGMIHMSEEMLEADFDAVVFGKFISEMRRKHKFVQPIQFGCIKKSSETYRLKDAQGIEIGWFDLEAGRQGIKEATIVLRKACLKYGIEFAPDIPSYEPFPHQNLKSDNRKRLRM